MICYFQGLLQIFVVDDMASPMDNHQHQNATSSAAAGAYITANQVWETE